MQISKSTLKKLIKEAALEYINSQQNLLAEKDLPAKPGDKDEEDLVDVWKDMGIDRAAAERRWDAEASAREAERAKLSPEQLDAMAAQSLKQLDNQLRDDRSAGAVGELGAEDGKLGRKPKSLAFFIKNKEIWGTRPERGETDRVGDGTMSIEQLHGHYMFRYKLASLKRELAQMKEGAGSLKETVLNHTNSKQNLLAEASDDGLKQLWSMFEDWHRYGMGRWDEAMYPTEVAAALQNMYSNRRGHMLKYVEMALGRKNKNLKLAQKEANKLFSKAIKTESFLSRLSESGSDRKVTKQLLRNAKTILKVANNHFSKTSSPSGSPMHPKLEAIVAKYAGGADDLDDL